MRAIDFHTHAFPDFLAGRAIAKLEETAHGHKAFLDGTISGLFGSMDRAGIETSVVCSIATNPAQVDSIIAWSKRIASERIVPFPSIHPELPDVRATLGKIVEEGFPGVKVHPQYQGFVFDSPSMSETYEGLEETGLILVAHCGCDLSFPDDIAVSPEAIARVLDRFPSLKLVATHMGGWRMWEGVRKLLVGRDVCFETSFSIDDSTRDMMREMALEHGVEKVVFGSDSPWKEQASEMELVRSLGLGEEADRKMLRDNALGLLGRAGR